MGGLSMLGSLIGVVDSSIGGLSILGYLIGDTSDEEISTTSLLPFASEAKKLSILGCFRGCSCLVVFGEGCGDDSGEESKLTCVDVEGLAFICCAAVRSAAPSLPPPGPRRTFVCGTWKPPSLSSSEVHQRSQVPLLMAL